MSASYPALTSRAILCRPLQDWLHSRRLIKNYTCGPLQCLAVPLGKRGASFICTLTKFQKSGGGICAVPHVVVHQDELVNLRIVTCGVWPNMCVAEPLGLGRGIR